MLRLARAGPSPRSPITPQKRHTASQNASGSSTDQRQAPCASAGSCPFAARNRAIDDRCIRSGEGLQSRSPSCTTSGGKWLEYEDRDLAVGLALVVRVVRIRRDRAIPPERLLLTRDLAGGHVLTNGTVLQLHVRVGDHVVVPDRVLGRTADG